MKRPSKSQAQVFAFVAAFLAHEAHDDLCIGFSNDGAEITWTKHRRKAALALVDELRTRAGLSKEKE